MKKTEVSGAHAPHQLCDLDKLGPEGTASANREEPAVVYFLQWVGQVQVYWPSVCWAMS